MKLVLGLLAVVVGAAALSYYFGGYASFDPTTQGLAARAAIQPGMTWKEVIAATKQPRKYRQIEKKVQRIGSGELARFTPGPVIPYRTNRFTGATPYGFVFEYHYSEKVAFAVEFDKAGQVVTVSDLATMADLLQTR